MRIVLKPGGLIIIVLALLVLGGVMFSQQRKEAIPSNIPVTLAPTPIAPLVAANLLQNVNMSAKDDASGLPVGWGNTWSEGKPPRVRRDESEFHSAPASLLLDTQGESTKGLVQCTFPAKPGERYKISGYIKSVATGTVSIAAQFAKSDMQPVGFQHIGIPTATPEWQRREAIITVPKEATQCGVLLYVDGNGKAWLDDVSVTREP